MSNREREVYTMEEFLEVLSIQEQTVFLEIKRKQRAAAASSQEDMQEMVALQEKKAAFEKKWREAIANPNVCRPTVIELFGELHYYEPPPSPPPVDRDDRADPTSSPLATFSVGESSRGVSDSREEGRDPNHAAPRPGGRNVGGGN